RRWPCASRLQPRCQSQSRERTCPTRVQAYRYVHSASRTERLRIRSDIHAGECGDLEVVRFGERGAVAEEGPAGHEAEAPRHVEREAHVDLALDVAPTHVEAAPDDGAAGDQAQALGAPGERAVHALSGRDQVVGARALAKKEVVDIRGEPAAALAEGHAGGARVGPAAIALVFGRIVVAVA